MNILKSIVDSEYKELQKFKKIANAIEAMEPEMQKLSDEELASKTIEFREELEKGTTLDNLIVPAFAVAIGSLVFVNENTEVFPRLSVAVIT